ncbi:MAG: EF-P lysine aminoacylase GenX [Myxococcales bacterium]|nr:EF-P lysine aminoacylase GenX [Myxococcales bacterium]
MPPPGSRPERRFAPERLEWLLQLRARLTNAIRHFFTARGYLEVQAPILGPAADPALTIEPFRTRLHLLDGSAHELFLQTSPEFFLKRLLAAGMKRIFHIGPFFRDGEVTGRHNPEFTGLEWYCENQPFGELLDFTEELFREVTCEVAQSSHIERKSASFTVERSFQRFSVAQALRELGGIEVPEDWQEEGLRNALRRAGVHLGPDDEFDDLVNRALIERVEPALARHGPVILYEYPLPMAALARACPNKPSVAERFELFAGGLELCNGYGELTDPVEQRRRFLEQANHRRRLGRPAVPLDEVFLRALEDGLPPCCGCALGLDRWLMLLIGAERIEEVLPFPLSMELGMHPEGDVAT